MVAVLQSVINLEADSSDYMQPFVFTHAWRATADSRGKDPMLHVKPSVMNDFGFVFIVKSALIVVQGYKFSKRYSKFKSDGD